MIVKTILNNNVILVQIDKEEQIIRGKAIGFKYKKGDEVNPEDIEKTYKLESELETKSFMQLLDGVPQEYFDVTDKILQFAEQELKVEFQTYLHVSITDHIYFAVQRHKEQITIQNVLLHVIQQLNPIEYKIGQYAVHMISTDLNINLPVEEAGNIALHIINASKKHQDMESLMKGTKAIKDILNIVRFCFNTPINENSLNYTRFVTHLQFFIQRIFNGETFVDSSDELYEQIVNKYEDALDCAKRIENYILNSFGVNIGKDELIYLAVHINRVVVRNKL